MRDLIKTVDSASLLILLFVACALPREAGAQQNDQPSGCSSEYDRGGVEGRAAVEVRVRVDAFLPDERIDDFADGATSLSLSVLTITEPGQHHGKKVQVAHVCAPRPDSIWLQIDGQAVLHLDELLLKASLSPDGDTFIDSRLVRLEDMSP